MKIREEISWDESSINEWLAFGCTTSHSSADRDYGHPERELPAEHSFRFVKAEEIETYDEATNSRKEYWALADDVDQETGERLWWPVHRVADGE